MLRPHITAFTIELNLSSKRMMAADYLATYVPTIPMANPTSDFLRAGASFVQSRLTATTYHLSLSPVTKAYLSSDLDLAKTKSLSLILSNYSPFAIVTILSYLSCYSAYLMVLVQLQTAVLHFLQTIPPTSLINSAPFITS